MKSNMNIFSAGAIFTLSAMVFVNIERDYLSSSLKSIFDDEENKIKFRLSEKEETVLLKKKPFIDGAVRVHVQYQNIC